MTEEIAIKLGDPAAKELILSERQQMQDATISIAQQASHVIRIFSHSLEPELYNQTAFVAACKSLTLRHPQCHVDILVQDTAPMRQIEHRLIALAQRLPSRITLKLAHDDFADHPERFLIADQNGLLLKRQPGKRTPMLVYAAAPRKVDEYNRFFQQVWDQSEIDSSLRRLSL